MSIVPCNTKYEVSWRKPRQRHHAMGSGQRAACSVQNAGWSGYLLASDNHHLPSAAYRPPTLFADGQTPAASLVPCSCEDPEVVRPWCHPAIYHVPTCIPSTGHPSRVCCFALLQPASANIAFAARRRPNLPAAEISPSNARHLHTPPSPPVPTTLPYPAQDCMRRSSCV